MRTGFGDWQCGQSHRWTHGCQLVHARRSLTQKVVQGIVARVARRAKVDFGVKTLRHTFCSHLAMRGAPARAIQELAGHQNLETTLRYMHLSPIALQASIGLLDMRGPTPEFGRQWKREDRKR